MIQQVITPDGKLHQVIVPRNSQYEDGDALLKSELDPLILKAEGRLPEKKLLIKGVEHPMPDEYYAIHDPYERLEYTNKFSASINLGISMEEVEKKVAAGELNVSLSEQEKKLLDEREAANERRRMLEPVLPERSETSPVKVEFLPEDGSRAPGWSRKNEAKLWKSILEDTEGPESRGINESSDFPAVGSDVPVSPSNPPGKVESTPSLPSVAGAEVFNKTPTSPTAESIKTQLRKQLSPERFDKARQLIDQYGTEEGLRRLREIDPDAARQFERLAAPKGQSPEQEQRERKTNTEP